MQSMKPFAPFSTVRREGKKKKKEIKTQNKTKNALNPTSLWEALFCLSLIRLLLPNDASLNI